MLTSVLYTLHLLCHGGDGVDTATTCGHPHGGQGFLHAQGEKDFDAVLHQVVLPHNTSDAATGQHDTPGHSNAVSEDPARGHTGTGGTPRRVPGVAPVAVLDQDAVGQVTNSRSSKRFKNAFLSLSRKRRLALLGGQKCLDQPQENICYSVADYAVPGFLLPLVCWTLGVLGHSGNTILETRKLF